MSYMGNNLAGSANVPPSVVNAARRDQSYFREISSPEVRRICEAMDEVLDPMEYEGSFLFDEYPDAGEISRLTDLVLYSLRKYGKAPEHSCLTGTEPAAGSGADDTRGGDNVEDAEYADGKIGYPALTRELAKALLCQEMCRRRFRHHMHQKQIGEYG